MVRLQFTYNGSSYGADYLYNSWSYNHTFQDSGDYSVGNCAAASLTFTSSIDIPVGSSIGVSLADPSKSYISMGTMKVVEKSKSSIATSPLYTYECYDLMYDLGNTVIDDVIEDVLMTQGSTILDLFTAIRNKFSISNYDISKMANSDYVLTDFTYQNVSARTVLSWIGVIGGGNFMFLGDKLYFTVPSSSGTTTITNSELKSIEVADYEVPMIDKLVFRVDDSDSGMSYGSGSNTMYLGYNPLINQDDDTFMAGMFANLPKFVYKPIQGKSFEMGTLYDLNSNYIYNSNVVPLFYFTASSAGCGFGNSGLSSREGLSSADYESYSSANKYNKLTRTLDNTISEVAKKVGNDEVISRINQSAETISIEASKINLKGAVSFSDLDSDTQTTINNKEDESGVVSIINGTVTADYIKAKGVTATSLEVEDSDGNTIFDADGTNHTTTIGGFNVTANTISTGSGSTLTYLGNRNATYAILVNNGSFAVGQNGGVNLSSGLNIIGNSTKIDFLNSSIQSKASISLNDSGDSLLIKAGSTTIRVANSGDIYIYPYGGDCYIDGNIYYSGVCQHYDS